MRICDKRPAIAMIELIFSIVIMGLVLLSAPMLISTASKTTSVALQQEGINEAAARINMILTYEWDENNNINSPCPGFPSILLVSNGDDELAPTAGTSERAGRPLGTSAHTFNCAGTQLNASTPGRETAAIDDQDDFNNIQLTDANLGTGGEDYIEQTTVNIATNVTYANDTATYSSTTPQYNFNPTGSTAGTTNIKKISVTLTSSNSAKELKKQITMHAFSCNTGSYRLDSRSL